ncbi:hypothetical protein [Yersinia hibernica]|uniref:Uncharacterized protein n=1 Tax=Yersinia enterocolitica LC20 TaxID=1443113 RepID=A0A7U4GJ65_YEREN|nr:hypothetical protein [Yersinia hibernica]AHM76585.1 hypothetical protein LC20_06013 [Yersinia hibernica]
MNIEEITLQTEITITKLMQNAIKAESEHIASMCCDAAYGATVLWSDICLVIMENSEEKDFNKKMEFIRETKEQRLKFYEMTKKENVPLLKKY